MNIAQSRSHEKITQAIKDALKTACDDMLSFCDEPSQKINAEYLLTVNVAKAINRLNTQPGVPYKIYIEKSTKEFAKDCILPVVFGGFNAGKNIIRKGSPSVKRNGRVDVAVYSEDCHAGYFGTPPLCAIEIKGFNPFRKLVIADLQRNLELLHISGNTGSSVLAFSLFSALHSYKGTFDEDGVKRDLAKARSFYELLFSQVGGAGQHKFDVDIFTVSRELVGRIFNEGESDEALDRSARHHFVGAIVTCSKKTRTLALQQTGARFMQPQQ